MRNEEFKSSSKISKSMSVQLGSYIVKYVPRCAINTEAAVGNTIISTIISKIKPNRFNFGPKKKKQNGKIEIYKTMQC